MPVIQVTHRQEIVDEARSWVGTRFQDQARVKGVACDCAGLILGVGAALHAFDVDPESPDLVARYGSYARTPNPRMMMEALSVFMMPLRMEEAGPGDVLYLRFDASEQRVNPQHLCVVTEAGWQVGGGMIHALAWPSRKVVEHTVDAQWYGRRFRAYRYPAVVRAVEQGAD